MKTNTGFQTSRYLFSVSIKLLFILSILGSFVAVAQQKEIPLYPGVAPGSENWNWEEKDFFVKVPLNAKVIYNITKPTLTVFTPDSANGCAVIICPGGGLHVLNFETEGVRNANKLVKKGITVFIFKYRLAQSVTDDPWQEMLKTLGKADSSRMNKATAGSMARTDLNIAIRYVRLHAAEFKVDPKRIGVLGFSAGGVLAASVAYNFEPDARPDFVAPIYSIISGIKERAVKPDAPPLFIAAATDDSLAKVSNSIELYTDWMNAKRPVELHIYARGGHGLRGLPAESWISRFTDWLDSQDLLKPKQ